MARKAREPRSRLGRVRVMRRVTQSELAYQTGLSLSTIQRLEAPADNPPLRYLANCALALGVPLEELIEDQWREWKVFDMAKATPPKEGWWSQVVFHADWDKSPYRDLDDRDRTASGS